MSLSQKHSGLILVPWFNSDEWRYVYNLAYSGDPEKQLKALDVLKIWKMRTPILSTGVEGTLTILDALLINTEYLSEEQVSNLYAVALIRFLNLSAANSERQGEFNKTSAKNDLPNWLIHMRHDIAHGVTIPSKYNLKTGLEYGFNWLKKMYWEPHSKIISDYYFHDESVVDITLINAVDTYITINIHLYEKNDQDIENVDYYENLKKMIYQKFGKKVFHPYLMLEIFLELITESLKKDNHIENINGCLDILVSTRAMLRSYLDVTEDEGKETIREDFVNIWKHILNLLHQYGMLFCLVDQLFNFIVDISNSVSAKKMASLWINEIFLSLQTLKEANISKKDRYLEKNNFDYKEESLKFQNKVLDNINEEIACYKVAFLDSLLKYNFVTDGFITDAMHLLKINTTDKNIHKAENRIYTLDDLKIDNLLTTDVWTEPTREDTEIPKCSNIGKRSLVASESKWRKIEDTSMFKNCPFGVLPHQIQQKHPFLKLS